MFQRPGVRGGFMHTRRRKAMTQQILISSNSHAIPDPKLSRTGKPRERRVYMVSLAKRLPAESDRRHRVPILAVIRAARAGRPLGIVHTDKIRIWPCRLQ